MLGQSARSTQHFSSIPRFAKIRVPLEEIRLLLLATAADTIPVGVPLAMTGAYTGSGEDYFKGIKMAIDEINESGGLLGKQLEIIRYDSKEFAPEVVMQGADYLCGQKKVTSVHAGWAGWGQDVRAYGKYDAPFFADDGSQAAVDVFRSTRR